MRRAGCVGLLMVFYVFLVGMDIVPDEGSVNVPEPRVNYSATIIDLSDFATRVQKFSFEGETHLSGKMGDADVSITFDRIKTITFVLHQDTLTAEVELKDGEIIPVVIMKNTACYGRFAHGGYRISAIHVKSIRIHGKVSPEKKP